MHVKIPIHEKNLEKRLNTVRSWKINSVEKREVLRFINDLSLGKVNLRVKSGLQNQIKYLGALRVILEYCHKPTGKLTNKDIEDLEKALSTDKLKSKISGNAYSVETKAFIKKALRSYLRW